MWCLANYHNNHSSAEIVGCLAEVMRKNMVKRMTSDESSLFYSVSTDIAVHKQLIVYVSYIGNEGPVVDFLCLCKLSQGDADTIYVALCREIKAYGLSMSNLVGFRSDGASVMTGRHNGVASKIKEAVVCTSVSIGIW